MKKAVKRNKGITLIALVITIIVMLILVAVTISLSVNGGLFEYAGNASEQTRVAIDDEKNWSNIENDLSTEDLIARFTTNKKEDLEKLRLYFTGSNGEGVLYSTLDDGYGGFINNEIITDANTSIIYVNDIDNYYIIKYHNNYYKVYFEPSGDFDILFTNVVPFTDEEALAFKIMQDESRIVVGFDNFSYWSYNNMIYKIENGVITERITLPTSDVIIFWEEGYIRFTPTSNQKWYEWASGSGTDDIDLSGFDTGLTLKGLITECNENANKKILKKINIPNGFKEVYLTDEWNDVLSTDNIVAGKIYCVGMRVETK